MLSYHSCQAPSHYHKFYLKLKKLKKGVDKGGMVWYPNKVVSKSTCGGGLKEEKIKDLKKVLDKRFWMRYNSECSAWSVYLVN